MKKENYKICLIKSYLKQNRTTMILFMVFAFIYGIVFFLYKLEWEAVLYASCLCGVIFLFFLGVRFLYFVKEHRQREALREGGLLIGEELPEPKSLLEEDYQEILGMVKAKLEEAENALQNEKQGNMEYYTTWVHQIKTPIAVMRMILREKDTKEYRELLHEVFRIEQYVEMVLSYQRLGSETNDLVIQEYDLDSILKQAIHKYAPQFVRKRIGLCYEECHSKVLTDEKWLGFIIEQLLSNAVKYTAKGTVTISVNDEKVLSITDTGIGIASEDLPRIFEKGFTGYNGRADKKSTGLGLFLCRMAANRLHHNLWATSKVGEGSCFYLDLHTDPLEVE